MTHDTMSSDSYRRGGFWARLAASVLDAVLIYALLSIVERILNAFHVYVAFELVFFLSFPAYAIFALAWKGRTVGKWLCGLRVLTKEDKPVGVMRAFVREAIGKLIAMLFLAVGLLWIALTKSKRGWHDYISGTRVVQDVRAQRRGTVVSVVVLGMMVVRVALTAIRFMALYNDAERMSLPSHPATRYSERNPSSLKEISALNDSDRAGCVEWLRKNGRDPVDYIVDAAKNHQVTIFGEQHWRKDYLLLLNRIVPELYYKAGITCLALEISPAEDNDRLAQLVTSAEYNRDLAMDIARSDTWEAWGCKDQWDVLEAVWRLNQNIAPGQKKMRVIGIDTRWDGPSVACVQSGIDSTPSGPWWERLRILRLGLDVLRLTKRDELMARNIEKEIIEKNERGFVWVGAFHSFTNWALPAVGAGGKVSRELGRMGFMLHRKYGDKIFQVLRHWKDDSPALAYAAYHGPPPGFSDFLEDLMAKRGDQPVGFTVSGSPFEWLRDSSSYYYHFQPGAAFCDVAGAYLFLKPTREITYAEWMPGFVSEKMFVKNKPYYEICVGHPLRSAEQANVDLEEFVRRELAK